MLPGNREGADPLKEGGSARRSLFGWP